MMKPRKAKKTDEPSVRDRLGADFTEAVEAQWRQHGESILDAMRQKDPVKFAELVARLIPPEPIPTSPYANTKSPRDIGRVLLQQIGMDEYGITDDLADKAAEANQRLLDELELIAAQAEN